MSSKLIKKTIQNEIEILVYRHFIFAGGQFLPNGKTKSLKLKKIGFYDYEIKISLIGETLSETKLKTVFY